jgi:hypothetical protein
MNSVVGERDLSPDEDFRKPVVHPPPNTRDGTMHRSPLPPPEPTPTPAALPDQLRQRLAALLAAVRQFHARPPTPAATSAFEHEVAAILRQTGRDLIESAYNHAEPPTDECPPRVRVGRETYRRRDKTPNTLGTLFGPIELRRCVYECLEPGEPCVWPLELRLGVVAGLATPALAERVGRGSAEHDQDAVRSLLRVEHDVSWSVTTLRKVVRAVRDGVAGPGEQARVGQLLELLAEAEHSSGKHRPTLACGRDGVMVPIRDRGYQEAATGTVSVHDRRGKRLGTVYLGRMPEPGQHRLTGQLTAVLTAVLVAWQASGGACPRLAYLSDGGHHPQEFFRRVLSRMPDPWRPGRVLPWQWTLDFFHACGHLWTMAESLFGEPAAAWSWYRRMRHWLRDRTGGVANILRSATQQENRRKMARGRKREYGKAYRYLRRHARWMNYGACRKVRLPIGSGVTEAACKTVFTQRLKRSGMTWGIDGGQVIVDLRVLVLSKVWERAYAAYLHAQPLPEEVSYRPRETKTPAIAA